MKSQYLVPVVVATAVGLCVPILFQVTDPKSPPDSAPGEVTRDIQEGPIEGTVSTKHYNSIPLDSEEVASNPLVDRHDEPEFVSWLKDEPRSIREWLPKWFDTNREQATAFLNNLSDTDLLPFVWALSETHAVEAANIAAKSLNRPGKAKDKFPYASVVARNLYKKNEAHAVAWAKQLPEPYRGFVSGEFVSTHAKRYPEASAEDLVNVGVRASGELNRSIACHIALGVKDPVAVTDWVSTLPSGIVRDSAIHTFAMNREKENPQITAEMALLISDEAQRYVRVHSALLAWETFDPLAAQAWMDKHIPSQE